MNLNEIQTLLDKADSAYYTTGKAIMEDARYDKLKADLQKLNPYDPRLVRVGSVVKDNILVKRTHAIPMGSLGKALNEKEYNDWLTNNLIKAGLGRCQLHASLKMDGGSFSVEYRDGRLVAAISRGDGFEGEDVTANAFNFKGLPPVASHNGKLFTGFVRGEVVLLDSDWLAVDPNKDSNPRNLAVGISRRKDGTQSEYLTFYAFRAFNADGAPLGKTEEEMSQTMKDMGFETVQSTVGGSGDVWDWYLKMGKERANLSFWIDGIVIKLNDIEKQLKLGESSNCPRGQIAIKFEAEGATTVLRSVTLQVGHTGCIVPVGHFEPVRIGGTTVVNATLCNWEIIETLGLQIGDTVSIVKAGDIIPKVNEVVELGKYRRVIEKPTKCPCCDGKVGHKSNIGGDDSTAIYCLNPNCPAVVTGKIDKYLTSLNILGIGESLIEALVNDLGIKDAADLYTLHTQRDEIADLMMSGTTRLGEKRADKLLEAIEARQTLSISDFLGSLGIFGLGKRRVKLIQEALPGKLDKLNDWFSNVLVDNAKQAGVPNIAERIHNEITEQKDYIMKFVKNGVKVEDTTVNDETVAVPSGGGESYFFCITGKLSAPKAAYHELMEKAGHKWSPTFCNSLTHLVAADTSVMTGKLAKAVKAGVKVISEQELLDLLGVDADDLPSED
jgi:DNA ligase (NAD+)